jgi:prolyl-tRNA synthetase
MEDFVDRYGNHLFKLKDRISMKEFQFDQVLLAPTAEGYRAIVELAKAEINPKILKHLSKNWSERTIENLL